MTKDKQICTISEKIMKYNKSIAIIWIWTDITSIINHLSVEKEKKGQTPIVDFYVYMQKIS